MEVETPEIVEGVISPSEKEPFYTRDSFLQPPDWRYQEADNYIRQEHCGIRAAAPKDASVQFLIRILRANESASARHIVNSLHPQVMEIIHLGVNAQDSAFVRELEAHIINGKTAEEAVTECGRSWFTTLHYEMYRDFFFDLSGIGAVTTWITHHLFEPATKSNSGAILRNRLLAYYNGDLEALSNLGTGMSSKTGSDALLTYARTERQKRVVEYLLCDTRVPAELRIPLMEAARKEIDEREYQQLVRDQDSAGSATLQDLAKDLTDSLRGFTSEELKNPDVFGLEYANKYTPTILGNKEDGKDHQ